MAVVPALARKIWETLIGGYLHRIFAPLGNVDSFSSAALCLAFDVLEHAPVDVVDNRVGPELPVTGRPQIVLVPSSPFQPRPPAGKRRQQELAPAGNQKPLEMGRMNLRVGSPLLLR